MFAKVESKSRVYTLQVAFTIAAGTKPGSLSCNILKLEPAFPLKCGVLYGESWSCNKPQRTIKPATPQSHVM